MSAQDFIDGIPNWARKQSRILCIGLCGSHANGTARPDSDIDLVLVCENPIQFLGDKQWLSDFGSYTSLALEDYGRVQSLRVHYTNNIEVEFGITGTDWIALPLDDDTKRVMQGGFKALYDPSERLGKALATIQD